MRDLGVTILTGQDAVDAFDADGAAQRMRRENAEAFARLQELLRWVKREHDNPSMREISLT